MGRTRIEGEVVEEDNNQDDINDAAYDVMRENNETGDTEEPEYEGAPRS